MANGTVFPADLDVFNQILKGETITSRETNTQSSAIERLEQKVGVNNSGETSTLDYKARILREDVDSARADLDAHTGNANNPHAVTKGQIGLGNVNNTSDADKPASTAVQAELDALQSAKIDKSSAVSPVNPGNYEMLKSITIDEETSDSVVVSGWTRDMSGANNADIEYRVTLPNADSFRAGIMTSSMYSKLAGLDDNHFKGSYISVATLTAAWNNPAGTQGLAVDGDYAYVGTEGVPAELYIWDNTDKEWVHGGAGGSGSTETPATIKQKYELNADTNAYTNADKTAVQTTMPAQISSLQSGKQNALTAGNGIALTGTNIATTIRVLTANTTVYVRPDGNDNNDGSANDAAHALKTNAGVVKWVNTTDQNNYSLTIRYAAGSNYGALEIGASDSSIHGNKHIILYCDGIVDFSDYIRIKNAALILSGTKLIASSLVAEASFLSVNIGTFSLGGNCDLNVSCVYSGNVNLNFGALRCVSSIVNLSNANSINISGNAYIISGLFYFGSVATQITIGGNIYAASGTINVNNATLIVSGDLYTSGGGIITFNSSPNVTASNIGCHEGGNILFGNVQNVTCNFDISVSSCGYIDFGSAGSVSTKSISITRGGCIDFKNVQSVNFTSSSASSLITAEAGLMNCAGRSINFGSATVTDSVVRAFSGGNVVGLNGDLGGSPTGKRYGAFWGGLIATNGGGANKIPGTIAGTTSTQGQYL
jgi:hypothetical protein